MTSQKQGLQEVLQAVREAPHHITGVAVFREEEGQLEVGVLLQLHLSPVAPRQLIGRVLRHGHHMVYELLHTRTRQAPSAGSRSVGVRFNTVCLCLTRGMGGSSGAQW